MSALSGGDLPRTTGSINPPLQVAQPLPSTLAYSDAAKIGEAASAVLAQSEGKAPGDWINTSTGSSGTIETANLAAPASSESCRPFSTIVTSIGGVHRYSGEVCQGANGRAKVQITDPSQGEGT
jgi:hypothetical protein